MQGWTRVLYQYTYTNHFQNSSWIYLIQYVYILFMCVGIFTIRITWLSVQGQSVPQNLTLGTNVSPLMNNTFVVLNILHEVSLSSIPAPLCLWALLCWGVCNHQLSDNEPPVSWHETTSHLQPGQVLCSMLLWESIMRVKEHLSWAQYTFGMQHGNKPVICVCAQLANPTVRLSDQTEHYNTVFIKFDFVKISAITSIF